MISPEFCFQFVKKRLGIPFTPFELSDEDLMFWLQYTVKLFSTKVPWKKVVELDTTDPTLQTEERNVFIVPAPTPILSVLNVYVSYNGLLLSGHPLSIMPSQSLESQVSFFARTDFSSLALRNSFFYFTYEFLPPNKLRITPCLHRSYGVELELEHPIHLQTIPVEWEHVFLKLYTIQIARVLATIRSTYRSYSTPVGEIELNPEALEELANRYEEELNNIFENLNPGIIVVRG